MEKVYIEYYTVKMLYDENTMNKFQNFNTFWEACEVYHNWCESHTFIITMTKTFVGNNTIQESSMAVYYPDKDKEDRETVFF